MFVREGKDGLTSSGLSQAVHYLHQDVSDVLLQQVFEFADVNTSREMDFKAFLAALTLVVTITDLGQSSVKHLEQSPPPTGEAASASEGASKVEEGKSAEGGKAEGASVTFKEGSYDSYAELKTMLGLIVSAYLLFDTECNGYIERSKLDSLIQVHATATGGHATAITGEGGQHSLAEKMLSEHRWNEMDWYVYI